MNVKTKAALNDVKRGVLQIHMPMRLGWHDLTTRYRRTKLGPFWIVLGTTLMVAGVGSVWSIIFKMELAELFPYLTAGFIIWQLYASSIIEGASIFTAQVNVIRSIDLPLTFHVLRATMRNVFNFLHNLMVYVLVAIIFGVMPTWDTLWFLPALMLVFINMVWVGIVLGLIGARFHDIPPLIGTVMTFAFLITPVMWKPSMLAGRGESFVDLNPFTYFLEILRAPLLGVAPRLIAWEVVLVITIVGVGVAFLTLRSLRRHLPFWM